MSTQRGMVRHTFSEDCAPGEISPDFSEPESMDGLLEVSEAESMEGLLSEVSEPESMET